MYTTRFKKTRGRPPQVSEDYIQPSVRPATLLLNLKQNNLITDRQFDCAQSFQLLYKRYLNSIQAPQGTGTNWSGVSFHTQTHGYRFTEDESAQDIYIKKTWCYLNDFLMARLQEKYSKFMKHILHDDFQINNRIPYTMQMITLICEGLNYLDG